MLVHIALLAPQDVAVGTVFPLDREAAEIATTAAPCPAYVFLGLLLARRFALFFNAPRHSGQWSEKNDREELRTRHRDKIQYSPWSKIK